VVKRPNSAFAGHLQAGGFSVPVLAFLAVDAGAVLPDFQGLKLTGTFDQTTFVVGLVRVEAADVAPHQVQSRRIAEEPEHFQPGLHEARFIPGSDWVRLLAESRSPREAPPLRRQTFNLCDRT